MGPPQNLDISSIGRRFQRYKIIYSWKILNNYVDNCGLQWTYSEKNGFLFKTPQVGKYYKSLCAQSFQWIAPRIFNCLPRYIRDNNSSPEIFKKELNIFLREIPDCPLTRELTPIAMDPYDCTPSISIIHWVQYLRLNTRT